MEQHRILRLLLNTFGFLGIQLRPLILNDPLSIINWSWNVLINLLSLYKLHDQKPFDPRLKRLMSTDQYLMYYLIKICGSLIFPVIYHSYIITYMIYGHRLIRHLQSTIFASVQISSRIDNLMIIAGLVIPTFFLWLRNFLPFDTFSLSTIFGIQIFAFYNTVSWILLYFIQLANLHVLEQIRQRYLDDEIEKQTVKFTNTRKCKSLYSKRSQCEILAEIGKRNEPIRHTLKNQSSITKCRNLFEEMKELAELNNRLQPISSLIIIIQLIHTSIVTTISMNDTAMADFPYNFGYFSEILLRMLIWFGLLTINRKVLQNFNRIEGFMLRKLRKVSPNQTIPSSTQNSSPLKCAKVMKFKEMNIYQQSFTLLLFDVLCIDLKFLLDWICFIAGYATLIHQTRWL
uniref:Uncharacterized protein LOC113795150 n=1 Tax=Dermatophagoides pteronyssinus TaxID=6956 RepID=A0A6P6Y988_DERPT|nr:uncharacterized protein LOC113795150 [Dermatophagoides pteronyssinus]